MGKTRASRLILPPQIAWLIAGAGTVFFLCSSLRHALFQSTAWDLGIFDQAIYLISQDQLPISSFIGLHILGDHASLILYPLALFYRIYPDVHWLFAVQAAVLAVGAWPVWSLARLTGLEQEQSATMAIVYLLYPVIFNVNFFDFHAEVIALPVLLGAILATRRSRPVWFIAAIIVVLCCKAVLSLTAAAMGVWLLAFDKQGFPASKKLKYAMASFSIIIGITWFLVTTQGIIPYFTGGEQSHVSRYGYLGNSVSEIAMNLLRKPGLILSKVVSFDTIKYFCLLCLPVLWGLSWRHLTPLVAAVPILALNVLADYDRQRSLVFQYSLPVIPFLLLAVIAKESKRNKSDAHNGVDATTVPRRTSPLTAKSRFRFPSVQYPRSVVLWSLLSFLVLSQSRSFVPYVTRIDTWRATREAMAQVSSQGNVLTDNRLAAHLAHRPTIKLFRQVSPEADLAREYEYVLFNLRHPWPDTQDVGAKIAEQLRNNPKFQISYERDQVVLFKKVSE